MKTTISTKGQIVLPAEFRQQDGIEPGEEFEIERIDRGGESRPVDCDGAATWVIVMPP